MLPCKIQTITFYFISLHNPDGTMPWESPVHNFITALIQPDIQYFRYSKMIQDG